MEHVLAFEEIINGWYEYEYEYEQRQSGKNPLMYNASSLILLPSRDTIDKSAIQRPNIMDSFKLKT